MKFFSQLFDAPAEIVVAHGRVVLAAFSVAAIAIDPTEPAHLAHFVTITLVLYAAYSVAVLAALHWRLIHNVKVTWVHTIDLAVVALLLFLTEGFSSPFLVFFTFALLAASLRWDWQGIAVTFVMLALIAGLVAVVQIGTGGEVSSINQSLIRAAYLIATGTILAYASAHREHERGRLAKLAHWPAVPPAGDRAAPLFATLLQSLAVLDASRAVVTWEEDDGASKVVLLQGGKCQIFEVSGNMPALAVAPEVETAVFSRTQPDFGRLNLINGSVRFIPAVLRGELVSSLRITEFSSAPFQGVAVKGRVFILGNIRPSDDHLPITSIIAARVGAELDRQVFVERAAQGAAMRERSAIMRDLHDGLLQNLTAVRTQLELVPNDSERARAQLQAVRDLLRVEQQRIREFVDATHAADHEAVKLETLRNQVEETANLWGCAVSLTIAPDSAPISRTTANQLSLLLAESIANAVRHGDASTLQMTVACPKNVLDVEVRDNGHGFPHCRAVDQPRVLEDAELPKTLHARVRELGGRMQARTSISGSVLRFELPI